MAKLIDDTDRIIGKMIWKIAIPLTLFVFLIIGVFQTFYTVQAGERAVILTFGSPSMDAKGEGLHLKIPFVQKAVKMTVQTQKYEADASAASKDLQIVSAHIATNYRLVPEKVPEIYQTIGLAYSDVIIQPLEQEVDKAITSKFTAEELITKREDVRVQIKSLITERLAPRGIIVEEVSITNFDFSKSFNDAIEAKVTTEQNALAAKNKLEQVKFEAQQKIESAKGDAQSIEIINKQLENSPKYIEYLAVTKWDGKLSLVSGSTNSIIDLGNLVTKPQYIQTSQQTLINNSDG